MSDEYTALLASKDQMEATVRDMSQELGVKHLVKIIQYARDSLEQDDVPATHLVFFIYGGLAMIREVHRLIEEDEQDP